LKKSTTKTRAGSFRDFPRNSNPLSSPGPDGCLASQIGVSYSTRLDESSSPVPNQTLSHLPKFRATRICTISTYFAPFLHCTICTAPFLH
jgi:hypothetical protein